MEFCPKCGSILVGKDEKIGCIRCDYIAEEGTEIKTNEIIEPEKSIEIVRETAENLPVTEYACEKCGHNKAYFWTRQTVDGDEAESEFYKCINCGNVVREEDF